MKNGNKYKANRSKFLKKNWFFFLPTSIKITIYYGIIASLFFLSSFLIFSYWVYNYIFLGCMIFVLTVLMLIIFKWRSTILSIGKNEFISEIYEVYLNEDGLHVESTEEKYLAEFKYIKYYRWIDGECILFVADGGFLFLSKKHQGLNRKAIKKFLSKYQIYYKSKWI